jgi:hypothetical protein
MTDKLEDIENQLDNIKETLQVLNSKIDSVINKLDMKDKIDHDVLEECKKMGSHIDFIENVYNNVKHPLGFICNKIKYLTGRQNEMYTLTNSTDYYTIKDNQKIE